MEDVDLVNLFARDDPDTPGEGFALDDGAECLPLLLGQLLRVIEERVGEVLGEDHGRSYDGAC